MPWRREWARSKKPDPLHKQLLTIIGSLDAMSRKIVATKEVDATPARGIREKKKTSSLYGSMTNYDGKRPIIKVARHRDFAEEGIWRRGEGIEAL